MRRLEVVLYFQILLLGRLFLDRDADEVYLMQQLSPAKAQLQTWLWVEGIRWLFVKPSWWFVSFGQQVAGCMFLSGERDETRTRLRLQ